MTIDANESGRSYRSSILFIAGLVLAAGFSVGIDGTGLGSVARGASALADEASESARTLATPRPLSDEDLKAARIAWDYFAANTRAETGLADSTAGFPSTTMWDQGSYLLAMVSAHRLGILDDNAFEDRATRYLSSMAQLPLFEGRLPNKAYDTVTLAMVDYSNTPVPEGIGWSALDVSRLLLALRILERHAPEHGQTVRELLAGWDLDALIKDGELVGATRQEGDVAILQEGRIGYEQYAARSAALWGLDVVAAISAARVVAWETVAGVSIPVDKRSHTIFQAITPTLSEPFILQGLEMGFDSESAILASAVYAAQEARFRDTGIPTMVSEDHIDREPWFLYTSVFSDGTEWAVLSDKGEAHPSLRTVSLKAAFAWDALFDSGYTGELRKMLAPDLARPGEGWLAGQYEADGAPNEVLSLNTNAVILEAIHFVANGPLWSVDRPGARAATERR